MTLSPTESGPKAITALPNNPQIKASPGFQGLRNMINRDTGEGLVGTAWSDQEAMKRADEFAGRELPLTALTLVMRDGRPVYQAVGGMGADSLLIDAETGSVVQTPPPGALTRYFRQAHFYFFAGGWQVYLLILMAALACASALSGIYLNVTLWLRKRAGRKAQLQV